MGEEERQPRPATWNGVLLYRFTLRFRWAFDSTYTDGHHQCGSFVLHSHSVDVKMNDETDRTCDAMHRKVCWSRVRGAFYDSLPTDWADCSLLRQPTGRVIHISLACVISRTEDPNHFPQDFPHFLAPTSVPTGSNACVFRALTV